MMKLINADMCAAVVFLVASVILGTPTSADARGGKAAIELAKQAFSKGGREAAQLAATHPGLHRQLVEELGETGATRYLADLSAPSLSALLQHGEAALPMVRVLGDDAARLLDRHGPDILPVFRRAGSNTAEWVTRHGDDGVRVVGRFGVETAESLARQAGNEAFPVVLEMGRPAVHILHRNPKHLPMLQAVLREGQKDTFLQLVGKNGDRFLNFLGRNWKGVGVAAACATFLAKPEPFIGGAVATVRAAAETAAGFLTKAMRESPLTFLAAVGLLGMGLLIRSLLRRKAQGPAHKAG